ncbi:MAG: gliding motility-associated lipoprotein GldD [Sphingobacteriales bacterium]|nr:gliding motility-associated lipoprotein GldD [Sphingobacteriales bacterium]
MLKLSPYCLIAVVFLAACGQDYSPKPRGYYKIDLPKKAYQKFESTCPYSFSYPVYASVVPDSAKNAQPCFLDVSFKQFNSRIHLTYQPITSKKAFDELVEAARTFAFKHTVKATAIDEATISYPNKKVYGTLYSIDGNTASAIQFFLTDSNTNYLRGALYFNEKPNLDSIQPSLDFLKKDIDVFIKTFQWKH